MENINMHEVHRTIAKLHVKDYRIKHHGTLVKKLVTTMVEESNCGHI